MGATCLHAKPVVSQHGDIQVTVNQDLYEALVGDTIRVSIEVTGPEGTTITQQLPHDFEPFFVSDEQSFLDVPNGEQRMWLWHYAFDTFDATATEVSLPAIQWEKDGGGFGIIELEPIQLSMQSAIEGEIGDAELADIKGHVPLSSQSNWAAVYIGLGIACLLLGLFVVLKRKKTAQLLSPYDEAIVSINALETQQLDFHPFYTELSNIVRRYIERRFHIYARRQTTREFLNLAKQHPMFEQVDRRSLATFLTSADLVKFARHIPSESAKGDALKQAITFVEHSRETECGEKAA